MNNDKIMCPRCGEEMHSTSRYCMKCGYLNYNHPDNIKLKPYMGKLQETTNYVNGQVQPRQFLGARKVHEIRFGSKTGSKKLCFGINILLYIACLAIAFFAVYSKYDYVIDLLYSSLPYLFLIITIVFIYIYAIELIFMKMNIRWWVPLVPIYNMFALSYKVFGSYLYGIIGLIPGVNLIYFLVLIYKMGVKFEFNGILFTLLLPIYIPLCGFGANAFEKVTYVNGLDNAAIEKEYKLTNSFVFLTSTILVACLGLVGYLNRTIFLDPLHSLEKYYYVYASRAIVNNVKTDIKIRTINCDDGLYILNEDGEYYFHYGSASSEADLLFKNSRAEIESYVKIVHENGRPTYYISLTDGKYGIEEKEVSKIGINDIVEMQTLPQNYVDGNKCTPKNR